MAQLEATIRSAHALLQAGLIDEATVLLAAFSPEVQPKVEFLPPRRSESDRKNSMFDISEAQVISKSIVNCSKEDIGGFFGAVIIYTDFDVFTWLM